MSSGKIRKAFGLFWNQTKTYGKEKVTLVGEDHLGNKYYETYRPHADRKIHRYFNKPNVDNFDTLVEAAHVPPCWDAWLRFRRQVPPTKEELEESEEYYKMQQEKAAQRKTQEELEKKKSTNGDSQHEKKTETFGDNHLKPARSVPQGAYQDKTR